MSPAPEAEESMSARPANPPTPRQADVARLAGVSQATVSAVLNGTAADRRIAPATVARVQAAIAKLGYMPNMTARNLRGGRSGLLGVHTFESVFPVDRHDYYHPFLVGIESEAEAQGFDLVLFTSTKGADGSRRVYRENTNRLRVAEGSVLLGVHPDIEEMRRLIKERYPFVFIGRRSVPGHRFPYVAPNHTEAVATVVHDLHRMGHRHIAYLQQVDRAEPQEETRRAWQLACRRLAITARRPVTATDGRVSAAQLRSWLADDVTAVLVETAVLAEALAASAVTAEIAIPGDLSVVVLQQADSVQAPAGRQWTQVVVPRDELGIRAVRLLMRRLANESPPPELIDCTTIAGSTASPPPPARSR
jgi:DNA-binding LacI/PurR family transcriptional regulator